MAFKCPACERVSHNPNDELHLYCGACHKFWEASMSRFDYVRDDDLHKFWEASVSRFDYVRYDDLAAATQAAFKAKVTELEALIEASFPPGPPATAAYGRAKALALTKLEEVYMWLGKAIRDDQVAKRKAELQEGRNAE